MIDYYKIVNGVYFIFTSCIIIVRYLTKLAIDVSVTPRPIQIPIRIYFLH